MYVLFTYMGNLKVLKAINWLLAVHGEVLVRFAEGFGARESFDAYSYMLIRAN